MKAAPIQDTSDTELKTSAPGDSSDAIRSFYRDYHDAIHDKRLESPFALRRYVHRRLEETTLERVAAYVKPGARVLDAGCGEGSLAMAMADAFRSQGVSVTAVDLSTPNLDYAMSRATSRDLRSQVKFQAADLERLPFVDDAFDVVVSSHVLEHLPDFDRGLKELKRVSKSTLVIGLPTCLSFASMVILGGDTFWRVSRRTPIAFWLGMSRTLLNLCGEGIDEGYASNAGLPHVWRYPWVMRRQVAAAGLDILEFEAPTIPIPYLPGMIPGGMSVQRALDTLRRAPLFRNFGYGSTLVAAKPSVG